MSVGASQVCKERDLVPWLESKLATNSHSTGHDSTNFNHLAPDLKQLASAGLWGSRSANAFLNPELLAEIQSCFVDLQVPTKLKLLLALLHLSKRNVEQWRSEIEDVLSLASQDIDEWVQTIAELLKDFPTTAGFSFNMNNEDSQFTKSLQSLRKILKKHAKEAGQILPLDAAFVNKNALQNIWGTNVNIPKHFTLKRKTKAAAQRVELLQKSHDAPNQKNKGGLVSSIVPIRARDTVRKMDTNTPLRGIPSQNPSKLSSGFTTSKMYNRPVITKKEGGAKLIDIAETPEMLKKRKKEMEVEEKAAKKALKDELKRKREQEREEAKERKKARVSESQPEPEILAVEEEEEPQPTSSSTLPPPSYVADLLEATLPALPTTSEESAKQSNPTNSSPAAAAFTVPAVSSENEDTATAQFSKPAFSQVSSSANFDVGFMRDSFTPTSSATAASSSVIVTSLSNSLYSSASYAAQMVHSYAINPNFAAAFTHRPVSSHSITNSTKFVRQPTKGVPTQITSPPFLTASQIQPVVRLNSIGQAQTVIVQNSTATQQQQMPGTVLVMPPPTQPGPEARQSSIPSTTTIYTGNATTSRAAPIQSSSHSKGVDYYIASNNIRTISQAAQPTAPEAKRVVENILMDHNQAAKVQSPSGSPNEGATLNSSPVSAAPNAAAPSSPCYTITKNVMMEAQELFKTANKLTRPEKALILGFMAGNRENPCPQMGNILTVRLSEDFENAIQKDGAVRQTIIETYFQMNYENGEWKKLKKTRPGNTVA